MMKRRSEWKSTDSIWTGWTLVLTTALRMEPKRDCFIVILFLGWERVMHRSTAFGPKGPIVHRWSCSGIRAPVILEVACWRVIAGEEDDN